MPKRDASVILLSVPCSERVPLLTLRLITRWRRLRSAGLFSDSTSGSATKPIPRPTPGPETPQGMCLDKSYDYGEVRRTLAEFGFTAHIRSRGEEAKAIKRAAGFKARRWVVEHTHSWLNRFRRILVRWDKAPENYIAFLHFACALITLRAAGLLG